MEELISAPVWCWPLHKHGYMRCTKIVKGFFALQHKKFASGPSPRAWDHFLLLNSAVTAIP